MHRSTPSESEVLISLLANSANMKELRRIPLTIAPSVSNVSKDGGPMQRVQSHPERYALAKIESSRSFSELLDAVQNPTTHSTAARTLVFFASYVSDSARFAYYVNQLRQEAINTMVEHGFSDTTAPAHQF